MGFSHLVLHHAFDIVLIKSLFVSEIIGFDSSGWVYTFCALDELFGVYAVVVGLLGTDCLSFQRLLIPILRLLSHHSTGMIHIFIMCRYLILSDTLDTASVSGMIRCW